MKVFSLKISSPNGILYNGDCESIVIALTDGFYGIKANHSPVTAVTLPCDAKITFNGKKSAISLNKGILHFENNSALIVTE